MEEIETKACVDCKIDKPHSEYHKSTTRRGKQTVQSRCKPCMAVYKKNRYWANHDVELAKMTKSRLKPENQIQRKMYYVKNKDEYRDRYLKYMEEPKNKLNKRSVSAIYEKNNADKIRERRKKYSQKTEVKDRKKERHRQRKETDIQYVIKRRLRFRLRHEIQRIGGKKFNKTYSTFDLVGCDFDTLKKHIESQFVNGMSWEYVFNGAVHIDHIKPCKKFDLTKPEEQKSCFHYTNLQPLFKRDNLIKGAKYQ